MLSPRRAISDDERGATVVIVALALIAMFGMLVLVVDVGGLLWKRRELVNGSDAAALSAAITCAKSSDPTTGDPRGAEEVADELAAENVTGLNPTGVTNATVAGNGTACHSGASGWVKVLYSQQQHLFFAPVLGFSNQNGVTTKATAIWGPTGSANPVPIVVYANSFNNCELQDPDLNLPATCSIWEDNSNTSGAQSGFGFLDLRQDPDPPGQREYGWDSDAGATCPNAGSDVKAWIENYPDSAVDPVETNYPDPTYVCIITGERSKAWGNDAQKTGPMYDLRDDDDSIDQNDAEDILFFPLNRCEDVAPGGPFTEIGGQLLSNSTSEAACTQTPGQYDIVGFVAMKIIEIYTPNEAEGTTTPCGDITMDFPASPPTTTIDLDLQSGLCGAYQDLTNVKVKKGTCCTAGVEYTYNQSTHELTWQDGAKTGVNITWDAVTGRPCGTPPSGNNSGHCMVVEIVDVQVGGGGPGSGDPNSNLRAVKLCDQAVAGSCDPISVPNP
jgi:Flp pilus assembly protein TadG